jgi:hypothetical protein
VGGGMGFWASDNKNLPQSPFTGQFYQMKTFCIASMSLFFLRSILLDFFPSV